MSLNHLLDTKELDIKAKSLDIDTLTTNAVTANSIKVQGEDVNPNVLESPLSGLNFSFTIGGSQYNSVLENGRCIMTKTGNIYTVNLSGDIPVSNIAPGPIILSFEVPHLGTLNVNSIVSPVAIATTDVSVYSSRYAFKPALTSPSAQIAKIEHQMTTATPTNFNNLQFNASYSFSVSGL